MKISECVFYTGSLVRCGIPRPADARDALDELFTHSDGVFAEFDLELRGLGLFLPRPPIRVVTITPGPGDAPFTMASALEFAADISRTLPERLPLDGLFFYINSRIQGVVSAKDQTDAALLFEKMSRLVGGYPEPRQKPHVAISNQYAALQDISRGCNENQEARQFERFLDKPIDVIVQPNDFFLYGGDFRNDTGTDDDEFFGGISQRIANAMTAGEPARMHQAMDEALNYMIGKFPRVSEIYIRAVHFYQLLEMTLVGADLIDRLFVQKMRPIQQVVAADSEKELRQVFHRQLDTIWDYCQSRSERNHGELMRAVTEYIDRNLSDSSLSILTIAENFHIHPNRLSASFRAYFQETIPHMIHQRRVDYIKRQLLHTDLTVREIAVNAGYVSIATMNRAFLKQEGTYPGQYRKQHRPETLPEAKEP